MGGWKGVVRSRRRRGKLEGINSKIILRTKSRRAQAHREAAGGGGGHSYRWAESAQPQFELPDGFGAQLALQAPRASAFAASGNPVLCAAPTLPNLPDFPPPCRFGLPPRPAQSPPSPVSLLYFALGPPLIPGDPGWGTPDLASSAPPPSTLCPRWYLHPLPLPPTTCPSSRALPVHPAHPWERRA